MSQFSDIEVRRIRNETIRLVIQLLTRNARDPARIGLRVLQWDFVLRRKADGEKLLSFAQRIGVSEARACVAVANAEAALAEIRNVNLAGNTPPPSGKSKREQII